MQDPDQHVADLLDRRPSAVVAAYRRNYRIPNNVALTPDMIAHHWKVERAGASAMLAAPTSDRPQATEQAYSAMYASCPWLNTGGSPPGQHDRRFSHYRALLGPAKRIYEVGSGKGELITWLARHGYDCVGTEITLERGDALAPDASGVVWHVSDGVHLDRFEQPGSYDAVISANVLEHLHPEDLPQHLASVRTILAPGGRYVLTTPHAYLGPTDLSRVFKFGQPICLHLKEYRYRDLRQPLRAAGFETVRAFYSPPRMLAQRFPWLATAWQSEGYFRALLGAEALLERLPATMRNRVARAMHRALLWRPDVSIVAQRR